MASRRIAQPMRIFIKALYLKTEPRGPFPRRCDRPRSQAPPGNEEKRMTCPSPIHVPRLYRLFQLRRVCAMRWHPMWGFILFLLATLAAASFAPAADIRNPDGYETRNLEGFTVYASKAVAARSEEHTSELQSRRDLVCRLLLEKKKT